MDKLVVDDTLRQLGVEYDTPSWLCNFGEVSSISESSSGGLTAPLLSSCLDMVS